MKSCKLNILMKVEEHQKVNFFNIGKFNIIGQTGRSTEDLFFKEIVCTSQLLIQNKPHIKGNSCNHTVPNSNVKSQHTDSTIQIFLFSISLTKHIKTKGKHG